MNKVLPFQSRQSKVKKGGFLDELRQLLAPVGVNPTVTALGLAATARTLNKRKHRSTKKSSPTKRSKSPKRKQKGGDLLRELIAPQGLSATGTAALLMGVNALSRKSPAKRRSPKKTAKKRTTTKKTVKKTTKKRASPKRPAKKTKKTKKAKSTVAKKGKRSTLKRR